MTVLNSIHRRLAVAGAALASASLAVGGILQLTDEQSGQTTVVGVEHVTLGALTVTLIALIPVVLAFGQIAGRAWPGRIATAGLLVLAALTMISNVRGEDPSFFPPVAVVSNLLIVVGLIGLAVTLTRSGRFPKALAIALPVTWVFVLPLSAIGGGLAASAYWLVIAWLLHQGELPRRTSPQLGTA
jgi:hypothetical protein